MSDIAIYVEDLSKRYRIGGPSTGLRTGPQARYKTIRESLTDMVQAPFRRAARLLRGQAYGAAEMDETIWALKDVSFEVKRGEVVGIIGRNGAGKTTLLKVLSRITEPTEGYADIYGRVGSLLEVGTGFHSELTGRENIYLNGAILGMKRAEIEHKFDDIVAFAEVEKFIDTPVKHYSSGMYVRLAFAVAAHLEPEILLVDEVLAVGDVAFQKKCLGKMGDVAREGRTVLFVSHNLAAVAALCSKGFLLDEGRLITQGAIEEVVSEYLSRGRENIQIPLYQRTDRSGSGRLRFTSMIIRDENGYSLETLTSGQNVCFLLTYRLASEQPVTDVNFSITFFDTLGRQMFQCKTSLIRAKYSKLPRVGRVECIVPSLPLVPGAYSVTLWAKAGGEWLDWVDNAVTLHIAPGDFFGSGQLPAPTSRGLLVPHQWGPVEELSTRDLEQLTIR